LYKGAWQDWLRSVQATRQHIVLVRKSPPTQTTIPNHKELDRGTLRAIIRQTGLTVHEFNALL
jgi:hypothetical protein